MPGPYSGEMTIKTGFLIIIELKKIIQIPGQKPIDVIVGELKSHTGS
jgi:hypothetical protein